ncbi:MAG: hypothetical protein IBJ11_00210 [Phycisphaerales bacterium]|nr:hypothetical protein [Phycisphaerales bacterium]
MERPSRRRDDAPRKPDKRGGGRPSGKPSAPRGRKGPTKGKGGPRTAGGHAPLKPRPLPPRDPARDAVMRLLARQVGRFPDVDILSPETAGMSARDAAFAHAIYDAVLRRWITLVEILRYELTKPWEEGNRFAAAAMLAGAAQILFLDKVPAHAAVNESVEWAKQHGGPGAGALTNAVLRKVVSLITPPPPPPADPWAHVLRDGSETPEAPPPAPIEPGSRRPRWDDARNELPMTDGSALMVSREVLPRDPLTRLAVATSHPLDLLQAWARDLPLREVRRLAVHGLAAPPTVLNTAYAKSPLPEACIPHAAPGHHLWTGEFEALASLLAERKDIWAQDPASSLAVSSVVDLRPSCIVDVCAGMGTKTRQLAAAFPGAEIYATDIDIPRLRTLREVFAGHERIRVIDYRQRTELAGKADLVLLDVPCSNTGVLARRVEARYRFSAARTEELLGTQRQIIADSIPLLRRGVATGGQGGLLYSTCSLDPRENEEQARWASKWHGFEVARENRRLPEGGPGEPAERYSDGSFAVLLR